MKRFFLAILLLPAFFYSNATYAEDALTDTGENSVASDKIEEKVPEVKAPEPPSAAEIAKQKDRAKKISERRAELESTQWQVSLVSKDAKAKPESDTFIFQNGEFKSENRLKRGFNPTNYTVTIPEGDDPSATFETMQSGKEGHIFVKGVWAKDSMEGQIIEQSQDNKSSKEYYFSKAKMSKMIEEAKKVDSASAPEVASEPSNTASQALVSKEASEELPSEKSPSADKKGKYKKSIY